MNFLNLYDAIIKIYGPEEVLRHALFVPQSRVSVLKSAQRRYGSARRRFWRTNAGRLAPGASAL